MRTAQARRRMGAQAHRHSPRPQSRVADSALVLLFCVGLVVASLPALRDLSSQLRSRQVLTSMSSETDLTYDTARMEQLRQAQAYNRRLGGSDALVQNGGLGGCNGGTNDILDLADELDAGAIADYDLQLLETGGPAMCWLEIPAIQLCEAVYHGTTDESLASGVGHLESSSLPVGGRSSRCVLAAHSGMRNRRMFDELDRLSMGDHLVIRTLGDAYCYEVYETEVLLPQEVEEHCRISAGEDLCTLMTCTPYGINTHRLLVHARRVAFDPQRDRQASGMRTLLLNSRTKPLITLAGVLGGIALATFLVGRGTRKGRRMEQRDTQVAARW